MSKDMQLDELDREYERRIIAKRPRVTDAEGLLYGDLAAEVRLLGQAATALHDTAEILAFSRREGARVASHAPEGDPASAGDAHHAEFLDLLARADVQVQSACDVVDSLYRSVARDAASVRAVQDE